VTSPRRRPQVQPKSTDASIDWHLERLSTLRNQEVTQVVVDPRSSRRFVPLLLVPLALAGLVAAVISATAASNAAIPTSKLVVMVLPKAELGRAAAPLELDASSSGVYGNGKAADDSIDPNETAASLARAGRLTGYELSYGKPKLEIGTEVDLFRGSAAASANMAKRLRDLRRFEGKVVKGVKLERVQTFAVPKLGDKAVGTRLAASVGSKRVWGTSIRFRLGALEGSARVERSDAADVSARTIQLALALEHRMRGVLAATIYAPDLSRAVLSTHDLPRGAFASSAYVPVNDTLATYERRFLLEPPNKKLRGGSRLDVLESDVSLYASTREADQALLNMEGVISHARSKAFHDFLEEVFFGRVVGAVPPSFTVLRNRKIPIGDGARGVDILIGTRGLGRFEGAFVFARVGRLVGFLAADGKGNRINASDVEQLTRRMIERMRSV